MCKIWYYPTTSRFLKEIKNAEEIYFVIFIILLILGDYFSKTFNLFQLNFYTFIIKQLQEQNFFCV